MTLAPWRSPLSRALYHNRTRPDAKYFQLATVRGNGHPANRTVVFRGFVGETNQLMIVSDRRSEKIEQIEIQPWGEICWYFPQSREQFRLEGILTVIDRDFSDPDLQNQRLQRWKDLSDGARLQFAWPFPRKRRGKDAELFSPPVPDVEYPPEHFCLLLFEPTQVDHLELRGDPQNRWIYVLDEAQSWSKQAVNP